MIPAAVIALAGVAMVLAAGLWAGHEHRTDPAPTPVRRPDADAYQPCHTTVCAHMTTPHDRTPAGLTCRGCGNTTDPMEGGR